MLADKLKITRVSPVYKSGNSSDLTNYRQISVLPCFSKTLKGIVHNNLHLYVS